MTWLDRLFRRLPQPAWSRDPQPLLAFVVSCDGTSLAWTIADGVLTLTPTGGTASPLTLTLATYNSILKLAEVIGPMQGYNVAQLVGTPYRNLSPLALVEGSGNTLSVNGGNINFAQSTQYQILLAAGEQLDDAETQIPNLPLQMSTTTASGSWLDYLGSYFVVPRLPYEGDAAYAIRIIQQTIRPKCNNISMARALQYYTGFAAQVTDVVNYSEPNLYNGTLTYNGSATFNAGGGTPMGGLFDVEAGYDLIGGTELTDIENALIGYINALKAAGTALRNLVLAPLSNLMDNANVPNDSADTLAVTYGYKYDGSQTYNGTAIYAGGKTLDGHLSGS